MEKREKIYEGKAKIVYTTDDPEVYIQHFKDDATAFNALKRGTIVNKGVVNNQISTTCFRYLEDHGIATHFLERLSDRDMAIQRLTMFKLEVVMRNICAGGMSKRLGIEEGVALSRPILELYLKDDALGDPMLNDDHALALDLISAVDLEALKTTARTINGLLQDFFGRRDLNLVDFKLEFGRAARGILLGDEISPDTCRFWDRATGERLDKDRFRRDLGRIEESYAEVLRRVQQEV